MANIFICETSSRSAILHTGVCGKMKYLLFSSNTCKSCPAMKLNLNKVGIKYTEMNVDERHNARIAGMYQVKSLPTLVITRGGHPQESFVGVRPMYELEKIKLKYANL